jgi:uncharacterized membrane protein
MAPDLKLDFEKLEELRDPVTKETTFKFAGKNLGDIVSALLPYIFTAAGIGLLVYLIFGGISMMLSRGDPKALESAKAKITGALTGFIILFVSYWIVQIVGKVLGLTAITEIFSPR